MLNDIRKLCDLFDATEALAAHERMPTGERHNLLSARDEPGDAGLSLKDRKRAYYRRKRDEALAAGVSVRKWLGRTSR